jgi:putative addiction module component (TIGR02574 family)
MGANNSSTPTPLRAAEPQAVRRPGNCRAYTQIVSTDLLEEALRLSPKERLELIETLWNTLSEEDIPDTAEERALVDARLADLEANPGNQSPWPEVKARLERRRRKHGSCFVGLPSSTWRESRIGTNLSR